MKISNVEMLYRGMQPSLSLPPGKAWPTISLVTPNRNYADTLTCTLNSVLGQKYPNLEYIVMDGGSTDGSQEIIQQYSSMLTHWESCENDGGQYAAINRGFTHANGEIMGWLNSDDIHLPWTLHTVGAIFARFPEVDWIMGLPCKMQHRIPMSIDALRPRPRALIEQGIFNGGEDGWVQQESTFWRRRLWEKTSGLPESYTLASDFALWLEFAKHAELNCVSLLLGGFSIGDKNRSLASGTHYFEEVDKILGLMPETLKAKRIDSLKRLSRYRRFRSYTGVKRLVRLTSRLDELEGPVIRWSFSKKDFEQARALYCP